MAAHGDRRLSRMVKWCLPVAPPPFRCPAGIHRDHPQATAGGHSDKQVAERAGRDPRDHPAEALAGPPTAQGLTAGLAGVGKVEVLDHDRPAAAGGGQLQDRRDHRPQPAVAGTGRQPSQLKGYGLGWADRVATWIQYPACKVVGVQVDAQRPMSAQFLQRRRLLWLDPPGGVQVPAGLGRVEADVVADRPGSSLSRPFFAAMAEHYRTAQAVRAGAAGRVGQARRRGRQSKLQPVLIRMDPDCLIAPPFDRVPIGGQEPPFSPPLASPLFCGEVGFVEVVAVPGQPTATSTDRYPTRGQPAVDPSQLGLQVLQPLLFGEPLSPARIATDPATRASDRDRQPCLDRTDGPTQSNPAADQIGPPLLPLIIRRPRYRSGPTARRAECTAALSKAGRCLPPGLPPLSANSR